MHVSRRQFACGIAGVAALGWRTARMQAIVERRTYAPDSVLPPRNILHRYGMRPVSVKQRPNGTVYSISFASVEARVKAWDRFNADPDWCALRDTGAVALQGIQVYPAGKIFEISL